MVLNFSDFCWYRQQFIEVTAPAGGVISLTITTYSCIIENVFEPSTQP